MCKCKYIGHLLTPAFLVHHRLVPDVFTTIHMNPFFSFWEVDLGEYVVGEILDESRLVAESDTKGSERNCVFGARSHSSVKKFSRVVVSYLTSFRTSHATSKQIYSVSSVLFL